MSDSENPVGELNEDPREQFEVASIEHANRRTQLFASIGVGLVIGGSGAVWFISALLLRQDPNIGVGLMVFGLIMSLLGWLLTLGLRMRRKPRKTGKNVQERLARDLANLRLNIIAMLIWCGVMVALSLAIVVWSPRGREPIVWPILLMMNSWPILVVLGIKYSRSTLLRRHELYSRYVGRIGGS